MADARALEAGAAMNATPQAQRLFTRGTTMRILSVLLLALATSSCFTTSRSAAHTSSEPSPCWRMQDESEDSILGYFRELVTTTDPEEVELRDSLGLAAMPAHRVSYVTSKRLCARAIAIHIRNHPPPTGAIIRQISLIRVGSTRYALRDFYSRAGEFMVIYIYDEKFREISGLVG